MRTFQLAVSLLALAGTGCGTFCFGSAPTPVFSSSSTSARSDGARGELEQVGTRIRVSATHVCDVVRREERTAGHQAEVFHPLERLNVARRLEEQEASHLGPITEGIFRGVDDAEMQSRSLGTELKRSMTPWLLGAAAVGLLETTLKANARIGGKMSGEHRQDGGTRHNVRCLHDDPYADLEVALRFHDDVVVLGQTDDNGTLTVDLADAFAARDDLGEHDAEVEVLVAGTPAGRAHLDTVLRAVAARRATPSPRAPSANESASLAPRLLLRAR